MNVSVISLFPDLYSSFLKTSLVSRAQEKNLVTVTMHNLLSYAQPKERIDSPTFGHGSGMLLKPTIVEKAITAVQEVQGPAFKIFFSPHGKKLDQNLLQTIYSRIKETNHLMLLPARYEGMDARVEEYYADLILSIGDYVLMGGDLPAMVLMEGLFRLIPDIIGNKGSVENDSFMGPFVDYPEYTEPVVWNDLKVPEVIRSGNHKEIERWRNEQAIERTLQHHFEWLRSHISTNDQKEAVIPFIPSHYVVLMHDEVLLEEGRQGTSSVTSLDIHDIARSAATYGLKHYFIVTPLKDQQKIVRKLLEFWQTNVGLEYNPNRYEALSRVELANSLDEVIATITAREGKEPLLLATGAKKKNHKHSLTYNDQEIVWNHHKPVLFILGTARGLAPSVIERSDFLLEPIEGFSTFNHLSVRSAAAIIFDRWLGINKKNTISD